MAVQTRAIKRRIKSVTSTRKITKAMELVAASKMRKAVSAVLSTRPYATLAWDTVFEVSKVTQSELHPLLHAHGSSDRLLLVLLSSDRGLAGGFNVNMIRKTIEQIKSWGGKEVDVICIGRRGAQAMKKAGKNIIASFTDITNAPAYKDTLPIGRLIVSEFIKGTYSQVFVAYTDFVSAISQAPTIFQLLPLGELRESKTLGHVSQESSQETTMYSREYAFEPSPAEVLDVLLPKLIETMLYQAVLESAASEHSARMMAMRSASDAASEMIHDLTFTYNQARQAGITQEIAEISSGKAALEQANV
jgi:F-type H+-transporting ATPase subunit gamma